MSITITARNKWITAANGNMIWLMDNYGSLLDILKRFNKSRYYSDQVRSSFNTITLDVPRSIGILSQQNKKNLEEKLKRVLKVFALHHEYLQSHSHVCSHLLTILKDESECYWIFGLLYQQTYDINNTATTHSRFAKVNLICRKLCTDILPEIFDENVFVILYSQFTLTFGLIVPFVSDTETNELITLTIEHGGQVLDKAFIGLVWKLQSILKGLTIESVMSVLHTRRHYDDPEIITTTPTFDDLYWTGYELTETSCPCIIRKENDTYKITLKKTIH